MKLVHSNSTRKFASHVTGPDGDVLTLQNLPSPHLKRWSAKRKAEVIAAVHGGLLTMPEACARYSLAVEEFLEWERHYEAEGLGGLRALAQHRSAPPDAVH